MILDTDILFRGQKTIGVYGSRDNVGSSRFEDIRDVGGGTIEWLTEPQTLRVNVFHGEDSAGGAGARSILLDGLDENFERITEVYHLDGLGRETTNRFMRLNEAFVETVGEYGGTNMGRIEILPFGWTSPIATILGGAGRTQLTSRSIPRGSPGSFRA